MEELRGNKHQSGKKAVHRATTSPTTLSYWSPVHGLHHGVEHLMQGWEAPVTLLRCGE